MLHRFFFLVYIIALPISVIAQEKFTIVKDVRTEWLTFEDESYHSLANTVVSGVNTIYFQIREDQYRGNFLRLKSDRRYFFFLNGKIVGEFEGAVSFSLDSLKKAHHRHVHSLAIHQQDINERDLKTEIISRQRPSMVTSNTKTKPVSDFRDFVVMSGLVIILLFLAILRLNPKLAADYFSVTRIFSAREVEDSQSSARLTSSSNVQFYILCSLMIGFYLMIIMRNLPPEYALPVRFQASGFWMIWWQWLKLSTIIFYVFLVKIVIIFLLTRLFAMRGMARFHFFNWVRLLLIVFGGATIILFTYFISRGDSASFFVVFLSIIVIALVTWVVVAFFKLSGHSEHSMFHLFSYICATEIIPLLITVKVLFQ